MNNVKPNCQRATARVAPTVMRIKTFKIVRNASLRRMSRIILKVRRESTTESTEGTEILLTTEDTESTEKKALAKSAKSAKEGF